MGKPSMAEWTDAHWCTKSDSAGTICYTRDVAAQEQDGLILVVCQGCGRVRGSFKSEAHLESHLRLKRINAHRPTADKEMET